MYIELVFYCLPLKATCCLCQSISVIFVGKLNQVAEKEIRGAPYALQPIAMADGSIKLLAAINSTVSNDLAHKLVAQEVSSSYFNVYII